ncbi:hypothetical protein [Xenorhabdus sp. IM139775]|uniref:hypothetical protein n=1 Tax=Xenorhabdus sp. IM139775 TaxID=3025876 RepID=UPI00235A1573|nr:hypothetical protein [Xenorhabdus sp. IM139775]MDC9594919.1 hypothetical protein [Xenorhabdus sp. IM139775]
MCHSLCPVKISFIEHRLFSRSKLRIYTPANYPPGEVTDSSAFHPIFMRIYSVMRYSIEIKTRPK